MINFGSFNRCCLTTLLCLALAAASQRASAECEDFLDVDFPSQECTFEDNNVDSQMVKFGNVDDVNSQSGSISVRLGSATYSVANSAEVFVVFDYDNCFAASQNGFDLQDVDNFSSVQEVAFIPSSTNPREIERIWVFRCDSIQFQSR